MRRSGFQCGERPPCLRNATHLQGTTLAIIPTHTLEPFDESDPDDFRPNSKWTLLVDPTRPDGAHVDNITLIFEEIAPGDRIPLHTHPIHEVLVVDHGSPEVTLDNEAQTVDPGAVVFIPAGTPHGTRNATDQPVRIHAMFPSEVIGIEYLERNPAPGTEADAPQPPASLEVRALAGP
jgi:quercetin dioxygenase-like cupin family protein